MGRGIAQERAPADAPPPELRVVRNVLLAQQLADYGREARSPEALAVAAQILMSNPTRPLGVKKAGSSPLEEASRAPVSEPVPDPLQLLSRAKELAAGDEAALAWIERLLGRAGQRTRGSLGGGAGLLRDWVGAGATNTYTIQFQGGELARVTVKSDQGANLDLFVYDESDRLERKDTRPAGECFVAWVPARTQMFRIEVKNTGNIGAHYVLATN